ncbi:hypothetical protein HanRHA438_Chr10g0449741 [Helianthus annuus]|nr:hypothetical protein HanRHA438_Chr10g0449741 [Helianthus annuus]
MGVSERTSFTVSSSGGGGVGGLGGCRWLTAAVVRQQPIDGRILWWGMELCS